jgi:hypothetical protein
MSVIIQGSGGVTTNSGAVYDGISRGTSVTASGTSVDFTSIPSWVKRITVMFSGVSTNGSSPLLVQVGAGSVATTGYASSAAYAVATASQYITSTAGFICEPTGAASASTSRNGLMTICGLGSNIWAAQGTRTSNGVVDAPSNNAGAVTLGGVLDRIRITTVNGTDTFDAGSINILYE